MFVGVILENFNQAQEAEEVRQKDLIARGLVQVAEKVDQAPDPLDGDYYEQYGACRRAVYNFTRHQRFDNFIAAVIMANVSIMATEHYDPATWFKAFLKVQNYTFSLIFLFEFVVKLTSYGTLYFGDNWCRFDFFLVLISVFDVSTEFVDADLPINPTILRVCRVMRIARILRLMKGKWAEDLRKLLTTVANSLAQAGNLGLLMFLLYFISACLGIELFGRLACTEANPCNGMSNKANFEHFFIAILTLFRLSTGDNWNGIMKDALRVPPIDTDCNYAIDCDKGCGVGQNCCLGCNPAVDCKENCCGSLIMSPIFFTFFILSAQFVMLNLVVAVLMKELGDAEKEDAAHQAELEQAANEGGHIGEQQETDEAGRTTHTSVEVIGETEKGRKSFSETMDQGRKYWGRRLSAARTPSNALYDFRDTNNQKVENVETIKVPDAIDKPAQELVPIQTGQTSTAPGTPDNIATESGAEGQERPPTRSAWEQ